MGLYRANLNAGPFRQGEIVDIDESEFASYIEKGWLRKFDEGLLHSPLVAPSEDKDTSSTAEPAGDASLTPPAGSDASPPVEDAFVTPTSFEAHAVDDSLGLGDH